VCNTHIERNVVVLGPTSERVEQQNRVLVSAFDQLTPAILHQKSVAVVNGVT
jgi:hypothetical protein